MADVFVVFGGDAGTGYALRRKVDDVAEVLTASKGNAFATVQMGLADLYGPILLDSDDGETHILVVYGGRHAPLWATSGVLQGFGWARASGISRSAATAPIELDVTVSHFGATGATCCWSRAIRVSALPRPMQRVRLDVGDEDGPGMLLHTLDVGLELHAPERHQVPFAVFASPEPLNGPAMMSNGWSLTEDRLDATNRLRSLAEISFGVEVFTQSQFGGYPIASGAEIYDTSRFSQFGLAELPRDVREAISEAMQRQGRWDPRPNSG